MSTIYNKSMLRTGGFSLVELLVGVSVFVIVVSAFFGAAALSTRAVSRAGDRIQAAFLVEEGVEAVRFLRDVNWKNYIENKDIGYDYCLRLDAPPNNLFTTTQPNNVLLLHMDELSGTTVKDSSGKGHDGTAYNSPAPTPAGKYNNAFQFDGSNDYVKVPDSNDFNFTSFTIAGWINVPSAGGGSGNRYIAIQSGGTFQGWAVYIANGYKLTFWSLPDAIYGTSKGPALNTGQWRHIAIVRDTINDKAIWYVDGNDTGSVPLPTPPASNPQFMETADIYIGGIPGNYIKASIDELSLYDRALSGEEIKALYENNAPACVDDLGKFKRTVKFQNVCRDGATGNITGSTSNPSCPSGSLDGKTKHARVTVKWGDFSESTEFYFANLFGLWQSLHE